VLATEPQSDAVRVVDAATHKLIQTIALPGAPFESPSLRGPDCMCHRRGRGKVVEIDLEKDRS
jgi:hypothetical protein